MKNQKFFRSLFIIIFIICISSIGITISKYYNSFFLCFYGKIAEPIFKIDSSQTVQMTSIENIGRYEFSIRNFENNKKSDVPFRYTIEVIPSKTEQLQYILYRDGKIVDMYDNKTEGIILENSKQIIHNYCLQIKYIDNLDSNMEDIMENVQIKIDSLQIAI